MTKLVQSAVVRTNATKGSICNIKIDAVTFAQLWSSYTADSPYVDASGNPPKGFENQCAIKLSWAIHGSGVEMKSFKGAAVTVAGKRLAIRAEDLAAWLDKQPFCGLPMESIDITGKDWQAKIKGKTGIVVFKDYWRRKLPSGKLEASASGDHIDLWNKGTLTPGWASFVRFWLGFDALWDISDLGESRGILFWEIK